MWRSLAIGVLLAGVLAGCSLGANEGASSTAAGMSENHGGWVGQATHYYDFGYKTCRRLTRAYVAKGKDPSSLTYATLTPDQFKAAAAEGCNAGKASVTNSTAPPMESIPASDRKAITKAVAKWLSNHPNSACQIVLSDRATCTLPDGNHSANHPRHNHRRVTPGVPSARSLADRSPAQ